MIVHTSSNNSSGAGGFLRVWWLSHKSKSAGYITQSDYIVSECKDPWAIIPSRKSDVICAATGKLSFGHAQQHTQCCKFFSNNSNFAPDSRADGGGEDARWAEQNGGGFHALPDSEIYTTEYIPARIEVGVRWRETGQEQDGFWEIIKNRLSIFYPLLKTIPSFEDNRTISFWRVIPGEEIQLRNLTEIIPAEQSSSEV